MDTDNTGVQEVVEQTTQETTPVSEVVEQEIDQSQTQQPQHTESETVDQSNGEAEPPKDNAAWAAMRVENKRLKEALHETGVDAEYLQQLQGVLRPQATAQPQYRQISNDADIDTVTQTINNTQQTAYATRQEIAQLRYELREREDREAETAYPELKSDPLFQQIVAEKKLAAEITGRKRPTVEIAREVKNLLSRREEQVTAQAQEQTKAQMLAKQQATMEAKSSASNGQSSYDDESLKLRARRGDRAAQEQLVKDKLLVGLDF